MSKLIDWIKKDRKLWKEILLGALVVPILAFIGNSIFQFLFVAGLENPRLVYFGFGFCTLVLLGGAAYLAHGIDQRFIVFRNDLDTKIMPIDDQISDKNKRRKTRKKNKAILKNLRADFLRENTKPILFSTSTISLLIILQLIVFINIKNYHFFWNNIANHEQNNTSGFGFREVKNDQYKYYIVIDEIEGKGESGNNMDLAGDLREAFLEEKRKHDLPLEVSEKGKYSVRYADSLARIGRGVYLISGYFNDNKAHIDVQDRSIKENNLDAISEIFGITDNKVLDFMKEDSIRGDIFRISLLMQITLAIALNVLSACNITLKEK